MSSLELFYNKTLNSTFFNIFLFLKYFFCLFLKQVVMIALIVDKMLHFNFCLLNDKVKPISSKKFCHRYLFPTPKKIAAGVTRIEVTRISAHPVRLPAPRCSVHRLSLSHYYHLTEITAYILTLTAKEKKASILVNKGFVAFIFFQKYVGGTCFHNTDTRLFN